MTVEPMAELALRQQAALGRWCILCLCHVGSSPPPAGCPVHDGVLCRAQSLWCPDKGMA